MLRYVCPTYLLIVFVVFVYQSATAESGNYFVTLKENWIAQLSVGLIVATGLLFAFLINRSVARWEATGELARIDAEPRPGGGFPITQSTRTASDREVRR